MITYPFQILKQRLAADVYELREVELYTGQDSTTDKDGLLTAAPGLYLTFLPNTPRTMTGPKIQSAVTQFEAMLLTECLLEGEKRIRKDNPQDHMIIFDKVYKSLQGFSAKISFLPDFVALSNTVNDQRVMASIDRIAIPVMPHIARKSMMKSVQRFSAVFYDHGALKQYTTHSPKPPLELEAEVELQVLSTFTEVFDETFD